MSLHPPTACKPSLGMAANLAAAKTETQRDAIKLGWVLIKNGLVSPAQLTAALSSQFLCRKKLGEVLMEQQLLSEDQLKDALREQLLRRRGHWVI
ncbi:MAG TPA: hypothetical protein V6C57_15720 [Coleofasciculaceae cyanobacterium]